MKKYLLLCLFYAAHFAVFGQSAGFMVSLDSTSFKFAGANTLTLDGVVPTKSKSRAVLLFWDWPYSISEAERAHNLKSKISAMLATSDMEGDRTNDIWPLTIDGMPGFEGVGTISNSEKTHYLAYSAVVNYEGGYVWIQGSCRGDFQQNLEQFKRISRTYKKRK